MPDNVTIIAFETEAIGRVEWTLPPHIAANLTASSESEQASALEYLGQVIAKIFGITVYCLTTNKLTDLNTVLADFAKGESKPSTKAH